MPIVDNGGYDIGTENKIETQHGVSIKVATKIIFEKNKRINIFFVMGYELYRLQELADAPPSFDSYNRNIQLIYPGIGVILKLGKSIDKSAK